MMKLSIFVLCVLLEASGSEPQVYEKLDDQMQVESNTRVVREPFKQPRQKLHTPHAFQFGAAAQQDRKKFRYSQQQQFDLQNLLRRSKMIRNPEALRASLAQNWKVDPSASSSTIKQNYQFPEDKNNTKKPVTSRKLKPSSYFEDEKIKRQDNNQIIYINPELVNRDRSEYDLNALNALVGQHPTNQLEGLKRLLETPHSNLVLSPIKSALPHPISEEVEDVPNPNSHPNINTGASVETIQSQLDEAAQAQLAQALADAQKQALAHVEAQHRAIARAQEEAQKKALAQIALHNQGIRGEALPQPLAQKQALAHVEAQHRAIARAQEEAQKKALDQIALHNQGIRGEALPQPLALTQEEPAHRQAIVQAQRETQKNLKPVNLYAPSHGHRSQNEEVKVQSKPHLKKVRYTKTHVVSQGHQSPSAYQQVALETQHQSQKVLPESLADNGDDHQYAARYAFGYKIRDTKMGNDFGHEEKRDGENARGFYHVLLPDGRMQKVEYYADPSGYHAKVTYENLAHH